MEMEKQYLIMMEHKVKKLRNLVDEFELAVIDKDDYKMANKLFELLEEVKKQYNIKEFEK